jgi:DNA-binding NarL/FixJ family response regulator
MTSDDTPVRVLLAEHEALFRDAIRMALSQQDDLVVVAEARDGRSAIDEAERVRPDVAILDADLPNRDGVRATTSILRAVPGCAVLVLSEYDDEQLLVDAVEAGASGYLPKSAALDDLIDATKALHRGEAVVPAPLLRTVLTRLVRRSRERDAAMRLLADLTPREREVLSLLAAGSDNDAIALRLVISPETARTHIQRVLGKLGVHSRIEAASFVSRTGLADHLREYEGAAS